MGTLAEEFAAMPRSRGRASKRAKTEKGAKTTASSPSDNPAADGAASGGGGGVHPSSKISEVRPISYCLRVHASTPPPSPLSSSIYLWLVHTYLPHLRLPLR